MDTSVYHVPNDPGGASDSFFAARRAYFGLSLVQRRQLGHYPIRFPRGQRVKTEGTREKKSLTLARQCRAVPHGR